LSAGVESGNLMAGSRSEAWSTVHNTGRRLTACSRQWNRDKRGSCMSQRRESSKITGSHTLTYLPLSGDFELRFLHLQRLYLFEG